MTIDDQAWSCQRVDEELAQTRFVLIMILWGKIRRGCWNDGLGFLSAY